MPAWVWVTAASAVLFVLLVTFGRGWWRSVLYSWREAAHVIEEARRVPPGASALQVWEYGSMNLADERDWHGSAPVTCMDDPVNRATWRPGEDRPPWLPTPPELAHEPDWRDEARAGMVVVVRDGKPRYEYPPGPDWREQTAADLAPEALARERAFQEMVALTEELGLYEDDPPGSDADAEAWGGREPSASYAEWAAEGRDDSGPGDLPSLDPGPDLCAGCMCESHCDGAENDCVCTCTFPADWAEPDGYDWEPIEPIEREPSRLADPGPDPFTWSGEVREAVGPERPAPEPHLPDLERLADTGDIRDARLLADVEAYMRAQDDDVTAFVSRLRSVCAQARLDLTAALA